MNAETKIALVLMAVLAVGVALIAVGLGGTSKLAMVGTGIAVTAVCTSMLAAMWGRGR